jgi:hypothetical protein
VRGPGHEANDFDEVEKMDVVEWLDVDDASPDPLSRARALSQLQSEERTERVRIRRLSPGVLGSAGEVRRGNLKPEPSDDESPTVILEAPCARGPSANREVGKTKRTASRTPRGPLVRLFARVLELIEAVLFARRSTTPSPTISASPTRRIPDPFRMRVEEIFWWDGRTIFIGEMDGEHDILEQSIWRLFTSAGNCSLVGMEGELVASPNGSHRRAISTWENMDLALLCTAEGPIELVRVREA